MTTATAQTATADHPSRTALAGHSARAAPAPRYDRQTKLLAAITGIGALVALAFFIGLIAIFGANGRAQRAYSAEHPVPPVTRLAR